jgi:hypothetical protein
MKCFVHLGKHGDLMILMPGWQRMFIETGERPVVMVAKEFADTLEGISYVRRWTVPLHWYGDCGDARVWAEKEFGKDNVIFPKWWDDPTFTPPAIRHDATSLIIHGRKMQIEKGEWFSYMSSQWKYAGFKMEHLMDCPVFDRRRPGVEAALRVHLFRTKKPKLLICLNTGGSSPFGFEPEVQKTIREFKDDFEIIDLMNVRAERIFDLLGLFDHPEAALITSDTATLHLAGASKIPYVAYIAGGGGGSIPRGNCLATIRYDDTVRRIKDLELFLENHHALHNRDGLVSQIIDRQGRPIKTGGSLADQHP